MCVTAVTAVHAGSARGHVPGCPAACLPHLTHPPALLLSQRSFATAYRAAAQRLLTCSSADTLPGPPTHPPALRSDYNIALRIELKRREVKDDPRRIAELAAYFTHCNLQVGQLCCVAVLLSCLAFKTTGDLPEQTCRQKLAAAGAGQPSRCGILAAVHERCSSSPKPALTSCLPTHPHHCSECTWPCPCAPP